MEEFDLSQPNYNCDKTVDIQNWTDHKIDNEVLVFPLAKILLVKAFIPVVFVIGVFGNVAFLVLLVRVKSMRTITNFYLANLAAVDLMFLSLQTLHQSWSYRAVLLLGAPFYKSLGCGIYFFIIHLSSCASVLFITLVSSDRYFAVCHPVWYRNKKSKKQRSCIFTLLMWVFSAAFGVLGTLSFGRLVVDYCILWPSREKYKHFSEAVKNCKPIHPLFGEVSLKVYLALFITSVIANSIINIKIVQGLTRPPPGENEPQQNQRIKRKITWMLLVNSLVFFCSIAPLNSVSLINILSLPNPNPFFLWAITFGLAMINSALNPILYGVFSPSYRRAFLKAFGLTRNRIVPIGEQNTDRSTT